MLAEVILSDAPSSLDKIFHYQIPIELRDALKLGSQVEIPFGNSKRIGFVVGFAEKSEIENLKSISAIVSKNPVFDEKLLKTARWMGKYYNSSFIKALRATLPPKTRSKKPKKSKKNTIIQNETAAKEHINYENLNTKNLALNKYQEEAVNEITSCVKEKQGKTFLVFGQSGSGKTEVYIRSIINALESGFGAIILVPEIGIASTIRDRLYSAFNENLAVIHSGLSDKEREDLWERIRSGEKKVVLGTRVALFSPVQNLGLIIIDEEYETTYKQEQTPKYHAVKVAEFISEDSSIPLVLGASTPSIETFYKAQTGKYKLLKLEERIFKAPLPEVKIIDMRESKGKLLSKELKEAISSALSKGEKVILFINRRGFFTYAMCKECGTPVQCPKCSVSMIYHFKDNKLVCSHCGYESPINVVCSVCGKSAIKFLGMGTQRVEEELGELYKKAKIVRIDKDSVSKKGSHEVLFSAFAKGDADILIGTQMVTKGMDVAKVSVVGIISAETMLTTPDFRGAEHTFQQIVQVSARAGRHNIPGRVFIQTNMPENYVIKFSAEYDFLGFYEKEIKTRRDLFYPPFSSIINIIVSEKSEKRAKETSEKISGELKKLGSDFRVLGPMKAPIEKLKGKYRYQIILKGETMDLLKNHLRTAIKNFAPEERKLLSIDIDPVNLL